MQNQCIDYNYEFDNHLRCPNCNRKTQGPENFKNKKTGDITRTCDKCRASVLASVKKNSKKYPKKRKPTNKCLLETSKLIISQIDSDILDNIILNNPHIQEHLKYLK